MLADDRGTELVVLSRDGREAFDHSKRQEMPEASRLPSSRRFSFTVEPVVATNVTGPAFARTATQSYLK